jgi:hypothetical protein
MAKYLGKGGPQNISWAKIWVTADLTKSDEKGKII